MKILVVDDDFQNRDILKTRLEEAGYEIFEAENGDKALELVEKEDFSLILLDVMMPKKDGWKVCKELKSNPKTRKVPVIILTARVQPIDEMRSWESGVDGYMQKPIDHVLLLETVKRLLGGERGNHGTQENS